MGQYKGTALVTKGAAKTTEFNIYNCVGGRTTNIGIIKANDSSVWTVPAAVNYSNTLFPFSSDLHNSCNGKTYNNYQAAIAALDGNDIVPIDADGEIITAYIFSDNYFELYINGIAAGKDKVPYTQFNSSIVRFKVKRPFQIAMLLVDWEENLGLGSELNGGFAYHAGDGGLVAVFMDSQNKIVAKTDGNWKAQTYYTAPIKDLTCPNETGTQRLSNNCNTDDVNDGSNFYGLHWSRPSNWMGKTFDDSNWPMAYTYTNAVVGVNNKPAYTNFTSLFDNSSADAEFIWSSNLVLDNEVLVRFKVDIGANLNPFEKKVHSIGIFPNPAHNEFEVQANGVLIDEINIYNEVGMMIYNSKIGDQKAHFNSINPGIYSIEIKCSTETFIKKLILI